MAVSSSSDRDLGTLPPEFEAERLIGEGSAAYVYLARETGLGRAVAIKVLKVADGADTRLAARFDREAKAVASIAHPNVVSVHQYGRLESGTPYLVMHYVRGAEPCRPFAYRTEAFSYGR